MLALAGCVGLWAMRPVAEWLAGGAGALAGDPMMLSDLPTVRATIGFVLPFAVGLGALRLSALMPGGRTVAYWPMAIPLGLIVAHVLFKQVFAIDSTVDFRTLGLAERTSWQALLLAAAWGLARGSGKLDGSTRAASALALAALFHFTWFGLLLFNPLWREQAVGLAPIANLVLLSGVVGIATLVSLRLWLTRFRFVFDSAIMVVATLVAITLLRQVSAGSILPPEPMSQAEDLLRSLVGIVMAILFLFVGSRRGERSWRVGSLVLMTATVIKVFVFDTAGLEGLIRIASFVALGGSLIGIGWFYSRQLKASPAAQ